MLRRYRKGQTTIEYVVLLIIVMGALLGISNYFKRGMQGRWKAATDDMGDQYDPRTADSSIRHTLTQNTNTIIIVMNDAGGWWTLKMDNSYSTDQKTGNVTIGAY